MSRPRLIALLLALISLLAYLPVREYAFVVYDDPEYVTDNPIVQAGLTAPGVVWACTTWHVSNWHPLTWLSHMLDCELFGLQAGAHHLINALLHAGNALLVFLLVRRWTSALWASALVAALFAWHPLRVESVAWISERKDVLSLACGLLTLLAYTRYAEAAKAGLAGAGRWLVLSAGCFVLGLLAKPMLVTLPCVLLLLDWWPLKRFAGDRFTVASLFKLAGEKWFFFMAAAASCVVTFLAQRAASVVSVEHYALPLRLGNAVLACGQYLRDTVWPLDLALLYPLPRALPWGWVLVSAGVLAGASWFAWRERRTQPWILVGWLWFLGTLVPVIGLVQAGLQGRADRYTYLPHLGLWLAVVMTARDFAIRRRWPAAGLALGSGLALVACLGLTLRQMSYWHDSERLFRRSLTVSPDNPIAHLNLGVALQQQGRRSEAVAEYQAALRLDPAWAQAHNNLAIVLEEMDRLEEALAAYQEALRLNPSAALAHCNAGGLLARLGRHDEAARHFNEAVRLAPDDPRPYALQATAALQRGDPAAAVTLLHEALRRQPDRVPTLTRLARLLAAGEQAAVRNEAEALTLAQRANALTGGEDPLVLDALAMAWAANGRFNEARQTATQAIELANTAGLTDLARTLGEHLRRYEANQPWREPAGGGPREGR